jgi:hypothetical protein
MNMDSLNWYQGKRLKEFIEHGTNGQVNLTHLAVAAILAAREQGKTLDDIVHWLILANHFNVETSKLDKAATIRELGF